MKACGHLEDECKGLDEKKSYMCFAKDEGCKRCMHSDDKKDSNECSRMEECKKAVNMCMKDEKTTDEMDTKTCIAKRSKMCEGCIKRNQDEKKDIKMLPK